MQRSCLKYLIIVISLFNSQQSKAEHSFVIVDSWTFGYVGGFFSKEAKKQRFKYAFQRANLKAKNDLKIWGGLFHTDSNSTGIKRFGELSSRFTYQIPQTIIGFSYSQIMNTFTPKVNKVDYGCGATVLNLDVDWPGLTLGNYIYGDETIEANPNNRLFQHEYGHYLQSKRMGLAYYVRVGIPAILSKGDHDQHPVELDCIRRAFLYFNQRDTLFKNDRYLSDSLGWDFFYNPFPENLGSIVYYPKGKVSYINYSDLVSEAILSDIAVKPSFIDYASWIVFPAPIFVGLVHSNKYNRNQTRRIHRRKPYNGIPNF
ncbi:MAG: hypothetical protein ACK46Y_02130 [Fluviicola sp.]|jgi:hypothetical protein